MASKKIQGITIEIDGNTTKLGNALKEVDKIVYSTNAELKNLNNALKLDPKNTELLAQKQELLKKNIEESTNRLNALKEAQRQMGDYNSLTEEQKENYRALSVEIAKSEAAIRKMNGELNNTDGIDLSKVKDLLKKVGEIAAEVVKKVAAVVTAVGTAIAGVVTAGVKSYAELEQNIGGVETLFGDSAQKVIENAKKAYKTAGVSANEYMAGVTSFSASLLQSLAGDTEKAADIADMAFQDMSDNANKFGTDMSSIQNAYQGFAKQNYTMLDNLKLGYGGTKKEMERLLADAQKISGVKYDINNLSDVYNAIHVIQEELGVAGATAEEAATTISGSMNSMKAAFDNFINGSGSPEQLSDAVITFVKNVSKVILQLAPSILSGISSLVKSLLPEVGKILMQMLPQLFNAAQDLVNSLLTLIKENVQPIADTVVSIVMSFVDFILENLPLIIEVGLQIILALAEGIGKQLPELVPTIVDVVLQIVNIILDNIDLIVDVAIDIILALIEGIFKALPQLIAAVPQIITKFVAAIINLKDKVGEGGKNILIALKDGIVNNLSQLWAKIKEIPGQIKDKLMEGISKIKDAGKELINGLWNGIKEKWENLKNKVSELGNGIVKKFKSVFGIASPSKVMKKQIGENLGLGIVSGIDDTIKDVEKSTKNLSYKVETSLDPNINPNAIQKQLETAYNLQTTPILEIDYNRLATALADEMQNMNVVLDDREVGKFIDKRVTSEIFS